MCVDGIGGICGCEVCQGGVTVVVGDGDVLERNLHAVNVTDG
jgi:hypothetical protein